MSGSLYPSSSSSSSSLPTVAVLGATLVLSTIPFFWSTTFVTDDHLFLAFARYVANPLVAFIRDQHGGEYYRPLAMSLWWLLARIGVGAIWPFALAGLALHLLVSLLVAWLLAALGCERRVARLAAGFFFLSPQTRETALWFAALPDLLATAAVLGSLLAFLRGRTLASLALASAAYLSKESAVVLPLLSLFLGTLSFAAFRQRSGATDGPRAPGFAGLARSIATVVGHGALALAYLAVRWRVLQGWGGAGDEHAPFFGKVLQIASGLLHVIAGADTFPEPLSWGLGVSFLSVSLFVLARRPSAHDGRPSPLAALLFVAVAILPLLAAGWIVGARYFYLPAVGLAWLAGEALAGAGATAQVTGAALLVVLGGIQTVVRHDQVASYDRRVDAARRAVVDGVAHGHHVFHIAGGIKDLDLAVKESPALRAIEDQILVLGDVPASFVSIPETLRAPASVLIASPPLPPSGAYRFGSRPVVGLARRGDEPALEEVLARFPDLRFIRLRPTPGGRIIARDVSDDVRASLNLDVDQ